MPFDTRLVPEKYNIYKQIISPKVKTDCKLPNHYSLEMRIFQNGNVDVNDNTIKKIIPTILGVSLHFTVGALFC